MQSRCARAEGAGGHRAGHNARCAAHQQQAASPLTAEFQEAPETHNGVDSFTVRIAFSQVISISYNTVRASEERTCGVMSAAPSPAGALKRVA